MGTVTRLRLSILDQSPIAEGSTQGEALRNSIDLACLADVRGYHRYWLAEHHGTPGLACNSPEVLIGPVAESTSRIRVGSGGVMLPHYSPLKVAENFSMLSALFPGRIDLGIGRAPGTTAAVAFALQRDRRQRAPDDFHEQMEELLRYFGSAAFQKPEVWLLGSSAQSAVWAAEFGLPYAFADFINPGGAPLAAHYRQESSAPRTAVAVWAICAESDQEAMRLSYSFRMMMTLLHRGRPIAVPPIETAARFIEEEGVPAGGLPANRRIITGTPDKVRTAIEAVALEYGAEEVLIVNIVYDHAARRRSYELIAREFELALEKPVES